MRRRGFAIAIILALAAAACTGDEPGASGTPVPTGTGTSTPTESPSPTPSPTPTSTTSTSPTVAPTPRPARATAIAYTANSDIWMYNIATDSVRRITSGTAFEQLPRFKTPTRISFVRESQLREIGTTGGNSTLIVGGRGRIHAYGWSPDRRRVAFIAGDDRHALYVHRIGGATTRIRTFVEHLGRDGSEDDDISVHWSPDGTRLLVVDTPLDTVQSGPVRTIFVLTLTGGDVVPSRLGTFAIWASNGRSIYYRRNAGNNRTWRELTINSNAEHSLSMTPNTRRPALSLDGRYIAHDNASDDMDTWLHDLRTGGERRIRSQGLAAAWIARDRFVVTDVRACSGEECGPGVSWVEEGSTTRVVLPGTFRGLSAVSTLDSDVLIQ